VAIRDWPVLKLLIVGLAASFCVAVAGITVIAVVAIALEDDEVTEPSAGNNAVFEELIEVSATDNEFSTDQLIAPADTVVAVILHNEGDNPHNLAIPDEDVGMPVADGGDLAITALDLPAGDYKYICEVHPSMQGTLTVEPPD
jgi:plastocyanin